MSSQKTITIVGAGLAGSEAAWQCAQRGLSVRLFEMRPQRETPAHKTDGLAELVCSNSFKSLEVANAHGLLKEELRRLGSLILDAAERARVPAGAALAVDRDVFSTTVTSAIEQHPSIELIREEVTEIPVDGPTILATGPLSSEPLAQSIADFTGSRNLAFYDAISPIVENDSINWDVAFKQSRWGKGDGSDYVNCPLDKEQYEAFVTAVRDATLADMHDFDRKLLFEGCLPIEEMVLRGPETLRFGPMKPIGLRDPRTDHRPWAVVQLRQDNLAATHWSMVGFQTRMKWGEQKRIFRAIPGLENAEFVRMGMIHRNTYINAPRVLGPSFACRERQDLFFAGQLSGVEGYTESTASGLIAGIGAAALLAGRDSAVFPIDTALGALQRYISEAESERYQPTNFAFGLLPPLEQRIRNKRERKRAMAERALASLASYIAEREWVRSPARSGKHEAAQG